MSVEQIAVYEPNQTIDSLEHLQLAAESFGADSHEALTKSAFFFSELKFFKLFHKFWNNFEMENGNKYF